MPLTVVETISMVTHDRKETGATVASGTTTKVGCHPPINHQWLHQEIKISESNCETKQVRKYEEKTFLMIASCTFLPLLLCPHALNVLV